MKKCRIIKKCLMCGQSFNIIISRQYKAKFCSKECHYSWNSKNLTGKANPSWKGGKTIIKICPICKKKFNTYICITKVGKGKYCSKTCSNRNTLFTTARVGGNKAHSWKGGITPLNEKIRKSKIYKKWRETVFNRDNYTCQICQIRGRPINANHIKKFSIFIGLRFDVNNGITLCRKCHFGLVNGHEDRWEQFFIFNLITRRVVFHFPSSYQSLSQWNESMAEERKKGQSTIPGF